jgi:hypothetical protein
MRLELVIDEQAEALFSRLLLEWQRDQVAEAALGQRVLVGEQPVVRFEFQLPGSGAGMADDGGTEAARIAGRYGGREEDPGMGASTGARYFDGDWHTEFVTGNGKGLGIVTPVGLVKVGGEEMAGIVGEQWINADNMLAGKVVVNHLIRERQ